MTMDDIPEVMQGFQYATDASYSPSLTRTVTLTATDVGFGSIAGVPVSMNVTI